MQNSPALPQRLPMKLGSVAVPSKGLEKYGIVVKYKSMRVREWGGECQIVTERVQYSCHIIISNIYIVAVMISTMKYQCT